MTEDVAEAGKKQNRTPQTSGNQYIREDQCRKTRRNVR